MNFIDYKRIMEEKGLVTNPIAERYLAGAVVTHQNILTLQEDGKLHLIPEYQEKKDWYIKKAIEASWKANERKFVNDWVKYCVQIRNNIVEGGATREVTLIGTRNRPPHYRKRIAN